MRITVVKYEIGKHLRGLAREGVTVLTNLRRETGKDFLSIIDLRRTKIRNKERGWTRSQLFAVAQASVVRCLKGAFVAARADQ